jgi:hypothetical protein
MQLFIIILVATGFLQSLQSSTFAGIVPAEPGPRMRVLMASGNPFTAKSLAKIIPVVEWDLVD